MTNCYLTLNLVTERKMPNDSIAELSVKLERLRKLRGFLLDPKMCVPSPEAVLDLDKEIASIEARLREKDIPPE